MPCDAHIQPFLGMKIVDCELDGDHEQHMGPLEILNLTKVTWFDDDRRCYHGEHPGPCPTFRCILPLNHPRACFIE